MLKHCHIRSESPSSSLTKFSGRRCHSQFPLKIKYLARMGVGGGLGSFLPLNLPDTYVFFQKAGQESMTSTPVNRPLGSGDVTPRRKCSVPQEPMRTPTMTLASQVILLNKLISVEPRISLCGSVDSLLSLHLKLTPTSIRKVHTYFILTMEMYR